jgi:subtilisin-like proprotein convertase family protein
MRGDQSSGLSVSRTVNQVIPDDSPTGIRSSINVTERGRIISIVVNVSITHTWRGDLSVALLGPEGGRVVLHDRQGSSADDLIKSFNSAELPGLASFLGTEVNGAWTLEVVDHARADIGTVNEWGIDFQIQRPSELRYESKPAAQIPDNDDAGVIDVVDVTENQTISDCVVEVDISHSWKGDLRVSISAPNGETVMLHDRTGREQDNIREAYTLATRPELGALLGIDTRGAWTLRVSDHAGLDVGKLNAWALVIR